MSNTTPNKTNYSESSYSWVPNQEDSPSTNGDASRNSENSLLNRSLDSATGNGSSSKRGRPKSEVLCSLMLVGSTSPSAIKCKFCNRVFPRDKSLSAHLRTHTGRCFSSQQYATSRGYKILMAQSFFLIVYRRTSLRLRFSALLASIHTKRAAQNTSTLTHRYVTLIPLPL
jgi:hypothetical protein